MAECELLDWIIPIFAPSSLRSAGFLSAVGWILLIERLSYTLRLTGRVLVVIWRRS